MSAFLALWNDLAPGQEVAYEAWHMREHVPERVAAPGFRCGRRYVAPAHPTHRWFTLYDLDGLDALETAEYRDLLASPTAASAGMRPQFRAMLRVPCIEAGSAGFGMGAALAVLRLPAGAAPDLAALAALPGMLRARLGVAAAADRPAWAAGAAASPFAAVLLLDAASRDAAAQALATAPRGEGGVYDLASIFPGPDPAERAAHRRPGWGQPAIALNVHTEGGHDEGRESGGPIPRPA